MMNYEIAAMIIKEAEAAVAEIQNGADMATASNTVGVNNNDGWCEPTAEELKKADQDAALDDAYGEACEELDDLKAKTAETIWEYEYGGRKSDDDADERLSKLKETLDDIKTALNEVENAMYRYNKGWMEYWDADHAIFTAMNEF